MTFVCVLIFMNVYNQNYELVNQQRSYYLFLDESSCWRNRRQPYQDNVSNYSVYFLPQLLRLNKMLLL